MRLRAAANCWHMKHSGNPISMSTLNRANGHTDQTVMWGKLHNVLLCFSYDEATSQEMEFTISIERSTQVQ